MNQLEKDMNLAARGERDGARELPASDAAQPSDAETAIVARIKSELATRSKRLLGVSNAGDFSALPQELETLAGEPQTILTQFRGRKARAQSAAVPATEHTMAKGEKGGDQFARSARTPTEKKLFKELVCQCGTCGRQTLAECACGTAVKMRNVVMKMLDEGKSYDDVIAYHLQAYPGQSALVVPLDKGFNRLAWLFPYLAGLAGLVAAGVVALRWSRRPLPAAPLAAGAGGPVNRALNDRLDDELRDLD